MMLPIENKIDIYIKVLGGFNPPDMDSIKPTPRMKDKFRKKKKRKGGKK